MHPARQGTALSVACAVLPLCLAFHAASLTFGREMAEDAGLFLAYAVLKIQFKLFHGVSTSSNNTSSSSPNISSARFRSLDAYAKGCAYRHLPLSSSHASGLVLSVTIKTGVSSIIFSFPPVPAGYASLPETGNIVSFYSFNSELYLDYIDNRLVLLLVGCSRMSFFHFLFKLFYASTETAASDFHFIVLGQVSMGVAVA